MVTRPTRWFGGWGHPHLSDESLVELHALLLTGEHGIAARYLRHVKQCGPCAERLDALRQDCAEIRQDVLAVADARITPARLDRQFDIISRRLDGHSGRVLPFPITVHRTAAAPPLRRWLAMAAACGLLIGIGAGRLMGPLGTAPYSWRPASSADARPVAVGSHPSQETDEQMLVEIDAALARSRTKEFRALDELTPRIAEASARSRR